MARSLGAASVGLLAVAALLAPTGSVAQRIPTGRVADSASLEDLRFRAEAGVALATPLVRDANGTRVQTSVAPMAGIAAARDVSPRVTVAGGLRLAALPLRFRDDAGAGWRSGNAWQVDAVAAAESPILACRSFETAGCTAARLGAGAVFLRGPRDVVPFRDSGSRWGLGAEVGVATRLLRARAVYATAAGHAYHMFGSPAGPVRAGVVARVLVGVRYGR